MKGKRKASANPALSTTVEGIENTRLEDEEEQKEQIGVGGEEERPKLAEGFFEIEAIRHKRMRKGQLQYLIKWRGWAEAANTWEPLENLQSCFDVIDAFEESLQSGKSSQKRKHKQGFLHTQLKRKQPSSSDADYLLGAQASAVDKTLPYSPPHNSTLIDLSAAQFMGSGHWENNGYAKNNRFTKHGGQNVITCSKQIFGKKDEIDYDPKLSELRGSLPNHGNTDECTTHFQQGKALQGDGLSNGLPKAVDGEALQNDRCTGAKRRKPGLVKRFRKDPTPGESVLSQNLLSSIPVASGGTITQLGIGDASLTGGSSIYKSTVKDSRNPSAITKIIKPISYSVSAIDDIQDILVTFVAMRADGKEVTVDNRFLKYNYPLLLINFYEQNLKRDP